MTISVRFAHQFADIPLDIEFEAASSGVTALFGPSGAGKTTCVNAIAGLFRPASGRVVFDGETLFDAAANVCVAPYKRRIGYVFQDARLFPHLNVCDNLLYGWRRRAPRADVGEIDSIIQLLGVEHLLERAPRALSGGEKQRVALGRALLAGPRLLLLDEPLAGLDRAMKDEILPYFERLRDEARMPMIYVSHSADEVARIADRVILIEQGRVAAQGSIFDLSSALTPATRNLTVGAVIEGQVVRHLRQDALTEITIGEASLLAPTIRAAEGARVRTRIFARDITIALDKPARVSANNVLPVIIGEIRDAGDGHVDVQLLCGAVRLVAQITSYSQKRLALAPGMPAYAIIKSVMIDRRSDEA